MTISEQIVAITKTAIQIPFQFFSSSAAATNSCRNTENSYTSGIVMYGSIYLLSAALLDPFLDRI